MKRNRQSRIVEILALCASVLGLTLGFAAFSNTLTISSSTTASLDESDFKLVLYGLPEGNYDAHGNVFQPQISSPTCEAGEGTTEFLVTKACEGMRSHFEVGYLDEANSKIEWDITKIMDESGNITLALENTDI